MAVTTVTDKEFTEILEQNSKVIVKYFADWCGSCKLFSPKFKRLSEDERFKGITFVNVNAEENEQARKFSNVDSLPFFAIVKDGKLVEGSATSKEENVIEMLEKLL
ncbi:MAG: thioredoxin family protein [Bacteroidetes bacterium]|nr:thioredoxin family protein [Bacteroidota bacterium]HET6245974.1 thioredoxin family protein [Bacteroidia bacterium]